MRRGTKGVTNYKKYSKERINKERRSAEAMVLKKEG